MANTGLLARVPLNGRRLRSAAATRRRRVCRATICQVQHMQCSMQTSRACAAMVCRGVHANRRNTARQRCHRDPWRKGTRFVGLQIWFREMKPEGLLNSMLKVFPCAEAEMKHVADAKADLPAVCARVQLCFDWTTCGRTVMSNMTELAWQSPTLHCPKRLHETRANCDLLDFVPSPPRWAWTSGPSHTGALRCGC